MLSIPCDSRVKPRRNKKRSAKNNKIKPIINKYNWEGLNFRSKKRLEKTLKKNNGTIPVNFLCAKKKNYILPRFENITQNQLPSSGKKTDLFTT